MDVCDDANSLTALKESIRESEVSLRELKRTIETVDARLKRSRASRISKASRNETKSDTVAT